MDIHLMFADYKLDFNLPECVAQNKKRIEEHAALCWAADELENYILSHTDTDAIGACMNFIRQMSYYRCRYPQKREIIDTAIEMAHDILDILICEKEFTYEQV